MRNVKLKLSQYWTANLLFAVQLPNLLGHWLQGFFHVKKVLTNHRKVLRKILVTNDLMGCLTTLYIRGLKFKPSLVQTLLRSLELVVHDKSWTRHHWISFEIKIVIVDNSVAGENAWKQMEVGANNKNSCFNKKKYSEIV